MSADPRRPRVFISYRRADTDASARSIFERLAERFGDDHVFYDVDTIAPGRDFREVIFEALDRSDVLLAVIGPHWLARSGPLRRRRLDRPDDYVRLELEAALDRGVFVVPVLVDDARMPSAQDLPPELRDLALRHAFTLSGGRQWRIDVQALMETVARFPPRRRTPDTAPRDAAPEGPELPRWLTSGPLRWLAERRIRRRIGGTLTVLLGLVVLTPVVALAVGWALFDVPSADAAAVAQVATFRYADDIPLATLHPDDVNRVIVPIDQVPDTVRHAVLAAEDPSFYSNPGFDVVAAATGGEDSITQQYVQAAAGTSGSTLGRRYRATVLAVKISQEQTKDQILGNYLNVISFGRGASGIETAAQTYFGKHVQDLTVSEGALLAGAIRSPAQLDPATHFEASVVRWGAVLDGMVAQGWLSPVDRNLAVFPKVRPEQPADSGIPADAGGHLYNLAKAELEAQGISEQEIDTEGLTVDLTIDSKRQQQAVDAVAGTFKGQPANLRGALVSIDPKTGAILAYYGGENGVGTDYAQAMRRPGASFMPFVLSAALQDGRQTVGLGSIYDGSSPQDFLGVAVNNLDGFSCDRCSVAFAMAKSVRTVFYKMGIDTGPAKVVDAAHQAGIPGDELPDPTAGIALGDKEVRPVDMAAAFATFAADGIRHDPYVVAKVTAADGRVLFDHGRSAGEQVLPQPVARNVTEAMKDGPASAGIALAGGPDQAGKTGTVMSSQLDGQNTDAWMVGFTPSVSTAVWVGTDAGEPIKNAQGRPVYGRMLPGSIWQGYMNAATRGTPVDRFSPFVPLGTPP